MGSWQHKYLSPLRSFVRDHHRCYLEPSLSEPYQNPRLRECVKITDPKNDGFPFAPPTTTKEQVCSNKDTNRCQGNKEAENNNEQT